MISKGTSPPWLVLSFAPKPGAKTTLQQRFVEWLYGQEKVVTSSWRIYLGSIELAFQGLDSMTVTDVEDPSAGHSLAFSFDFRFSSNKLQISGAFSNMTPVWPPQSDEPIRLMTSESLVIAEDRAWKSREVKEIQHIFAQLCHRLEPLYAGIGVEYDLESPSELLQDGRSEGFKSAFVDQCLVEKSKLIGILQGFGVEAIDLPSGILYFGEVQAGSPTSQEALYKLSFNVSSEVRSGLKLANFER